jgi:hypothetical protein
VLTKATRGAKTTQVLTERQELTPNWAEREREREREREKRERGREVYTEPLLLYLAKKLQRHAGTYSGGD